MKYDVYWTVLYCVTVEAKNEDEALDLTSEWDKDKYEELQNEWSVEENEDD